MALDTSGLKSAMMGNLGTATPEQEAKIDEFLTELKTFVMGATINYASGLIAPPGTAGGPVTGAFVGTIT